MPFTLTTPAFLAGGKIPRTYTCDGVNISPALEWENAPEGTRSFALILDDPDAPKGTWNHWLLWDIPATASHLAQGFKPGSTGVSGKNDFGDLGYGGPCPPKGHGPHRYYFRLYAVGQASLDLPKGSGRSELEQALRGRTVGETAYMGTYERH